MTIAKDEPALFTVTVDGIEWAAKEENSDQFWCRAPGLAFFAIKSYVHGDRIFSGWCALESGCLVGVKDLNSATEAMARIAPRIRIRAKEIVDRERMHLEEAEAGAVAVGVKNL